MDKDTKTAHNRDCTGCKALNETNTHPKKKQGPAQIVRKIQKRNPKGKKLSGSPHRSLRHRHKKINYHLPSSDDEDMTDSKLPPKTLGFLCVSTNGGRRILHPNHRGTQNTLRDTKEHGRPTNLADNTSPPGNLDLHRETP